MTTSGRQTQMQQRRSRSGWRSLLLTGLVLMVSACGLALPIGPDHADIRAHQAAEAHYFDPH